MREGLQNNAANAAAFLYPGLRVEKAGALQISLVVSSGKTRAAKARADYQSTKAHALGLTVGRLKNKMAAGTSVRAKLQANLNEFSSLTR